MDMTLCQWHMKLSHHEAPVALSMSWLPAKGFFKPSICHSSKHFFVIDRQIYFETSKVHYFGSQWIYRVLYLHFTFLKILFILVIFKGHMYKATKPPAEFHLISPLGSSHLTREANATDAQRQLVSWRNWTSWLSRYPFCNAHLQGRFGDEMCGGDRGVPCCCLVGWLVGWLAWCRLFMDPIGIYLFFM